MDFVLQLKSRHSKVRLDSKLRRSIFQSINSTSRNRDRSTSAFCRSEASSHMFGSATTMNWPSDEKRIDLTAPNSPSRWSPTTVISLQSGLIEPDGRNGGVQQLTPTNLGLTLCCCTVVIIAFFINSYAMPKYNEGEEKTDLACKFSLKTSCNNAIAVDAIKTRIHVMIFSDSFALIFDKPQIMLRREDENKLMCGSIKKESPVQLKQGVQFSPADLFSVLMPMLRRCFISYACLAKGSNRNFTQSTLLQFRFDPTRIEKDKYSEDSSCVGVDFIKKCVGDSDMEHHGCVVAEVDCSRDEKTIQASFSSNREIFCQEMTSNGKEFIDEWRSVLEVVEDMQTYPPNTTKYQLNFQILVKEVLKNHCHLFTDEEKLFIDCFSSLSDEGQRLFIRLYTRKGPWFRMSEVSYPEIVDCQQAIVALVAKGFFYSLDYKKDPCNADMKEVLDLLTVSELREIMKLTSSKLHRGISSKRRNELITSLLSSYTDGMCPTLPSLVFSRTGTCVRISQTADFLLWRIQRLFFLNGEQDLSAFLMVDLGRVKYPTYNCAISNHLFSSRGELLAYEEAIEVAQLMDEALDANDTEMVMRCIETSDGRLTCDGSQSFHPDAIRTFHLFFSAPWIYSKVVTLGVSFLERERRYDDAIRLLKHLLGDISSDGRRGYWTLRLSIDLEHIGHLNESLSVAEEGLLDSWVRAGSRMALQRRVLRLAKPPRRWKTPSFSQSIKRKIKEVHIVGRPLNCDLGMRNRYYGEDGEQCGVEELVLQYYAGEGGGWHGVHTESGIWMTIFGLLMWEIMFADIPDVFHTRFQIAPLDLETDNFYIARKSLIESHLERIKGGMAEEILITSWESHFGTSCRGVNWDRFSLPDLRAAVTCVGGSCLASLCRLLAQDFRSWSSGMPDLLLWRFFGEYSGEAKLVEVKGPRDRLSEQQRAWLLLLEDCGFTTEVCKVSPEP
ncbi:hypothetical protein Scep_011066 [Stephania cephalantha]|uniref:Fanconi-associated nuclease n=1 Tax=Stephania cephalantha TaxID=152367 RepID=A0AAP0PHN0_9MAGN